MDQIERESKSTSACAAGLFGYSIANGERCAFKSFDGYLREMEQLPNFSPPPVNRFVAHYVSSAIGKTFSSS
ncbi:hypothetical protein SAMN02745824_2644 [Parasphingorhabdus marina DSM 22363]|uniref:Uncharacterized protein n=1 Tax=Parasphingorhabdus marina DSM 22363 TaxID=1123272 RepID=A0A1N6G2B9_9SPHN|nr:hypothetical protein [Parasphingorhabdus marina]SIO01637.1 hypothetical protein SAMN02745824_2644 [Parasphingorhabdus marina DSM 22363]